MENWLILREDEGNTVSLQEGRNKRDAFRGEAGKWEGDKDDGHKKAVQRMNCVCDDMVLSQLTILLTTKTTKHINMDKFADTRV